MKKKKKILYPTWCIGTLADPSTGQLRLSIEKINEKSTSKIISAMDCQYLLVSSKSDW